LSRSRSRLPAPRYTGDLVYAAAPKQLRPGNQVRPLRSGEEAFPAMLDAICRARRSICLETYIFESDETGRRFTAALCERAQAQVSVRVIYDAVGSLELATAERNALQDAGVQTVEYHPIIPWRPRFNLTRRDHRKILVVDNEVGFTGGLNLNNDYAPADQGGAGWLDMHCELRGPVVLDLARAFHRVWVREGGRYYHPPTRRDIESAPAQGPALARIVDNRKVRRRGAIRRAYLRAINQANESVLIMNAYFLPDRGLRAALRRAVKRGVDVRVIIPERSDIRSIEFAATHIVGRLMKRGVKILCWPDRMMHAKTAVVDDVWSTIGSYNLDSRSFLYNLEVIVEVIDRGIGQQMRQLFEAEAARCEPMTLAAWRGRSLGRKFIHWFFYQFRRWL
jgi:cardiolipin synthase A/B